MSHVSLYLKYQGKYDYFRAPMANHVPTSLLYPYVTVKLIEVAFDKSLTAPLGHNIQNLITKAPIPIDMERVHWGNVSSSLYGKRELAWVYTF